MKPIVLNVESAAGLEQLTGKLFQVHVLSEDRIKLLPVQVLIDRRCPVFVYGERCQGDAGHAGKHFWEGGD